MAARVVLISGCSSGIGLSTAVILAKDEKKRFLVYATMRNMAKAALLEQSAREQLNDTLFIKCLDVTSDESVTQLLQAVYDERGRIDVLINNAGIGLMGILETHSMDLINKVFDTNFFGVVRLTKGVIPKMKANRQGHIINISSMAGLNGIPFSSVYSASKFAVEGMAESLAPQLRKFNINISNIEPGPVVTSFVTNVKAAISDADTEGVDEETKQLMENATAKMMSSFANVAQSSDEMAHLVLQILMEENPHLRYQTSKMYTTAAANKLTDPTGDKTVDIMYQRFFS